MHPVVNGGVLNTAHFQLFSHTAPGSTSASAKSQNRSPCKYCSAQFFDVSQNKLAQFASKQSGIFVGVGVFREAASLQDSA